MKIHERNHATNVACSFGPANPVNNSTGQFVLGLKEALPFSTTTKNFTKTDKNLKKNHMRLDRADGFEIICDIVTIFCLKRLDKKQHILQIKFDLRILCAI
jgi:hypothetical protein